jgi:hypothetical protein
MRKRDAIPKGKNYSTSMSIYFQVAGPAQLPRSVSQKQKKRCEETLFLIVFLSSAQDA